MKLIINAVPVLLLLAVLSGCANSNTNKETWLKPSDDTFAKVFTAESTSSDESHVVKIIKKIKRPDQHPVIVDDNRPFLTPKKDNTGQRLVNNIIIRTFVGAIADAADASEPYDYRYALTDINGEPIEIYANGKFETGDCLFLDYDKLGQLEITTVNDSFCKGITIP